MSIEDLLQEYDEIVVIDTEYVANGGQRPRPICAVGYELKSRRRHLVWTFNQSQKIQPPWPDNERVLTVVWYGLAEFGFFQSMGWRLPKKVLDLYSAYCWFTNGKQMKYGNGGKSLLCAMDAFGLNSMEAEEKTFWRDLIINMAWTEKHIPGILDYCERDVKATAKLLIKMVPYIDFPRELFRGNYVKALSLIEMRGIPVDTATLNKIIESWPQLKEELMDQANKIHRFYEDGVFKMKNFEAYLKKNKMPWQRTASGKPSTSDDYFKVMAVRYPDMGRLREIRATITQFKTLKLSVGSDSMNRFMQSPFRSITGRNQPSNSKNIFGGPKWMRNLIQPPYGIGMSYVDWSGNEFGCAGYLSGDEKMIAAYESPDPYMWFAIEAGHAPPGAGKTSHPEIREPFKTLALALMYGQGSRGISQRLGISEYRAEELIKLHKKIFKKFWAWSDETVSRAMFNRKIIAPLGWQYHIRTSEWDENGRKKAPNQRSLMNWPMQTAGSEMMRAACVKIAESGINCHAVIHDAFLISAPAAEIDEVVMRTRECMGEASRVVLHGNALKTDAETFIYPERFPEKRGIEVWEMLQEYLSNKPKKTLPDKP